MDDRLILKRVKIENFRAYKIFEEDLLNKPVVLITGPNGYGKTTLIDAIEWGLTGDIKRISNSYEKRNTTRPEKERQENFKGQLKNKEAASDAKVRVEIIFQIDNAEFSIWREQITDYLGESTELNYSEGVSDEIRTAIKNLNNQKFYPYYVCDNNKAYDFLRTPRKDVLDLFRDFLQNNDYVDYLIDEIESLESISKDKQDELQGEYNKTVEVISKLSLEIEDIKNEAVIGDYPDMVFYDGENIRPIELTEDVLTMQLNNILAVGCKESIKIIDGILQKRAAIEKKDLIEKLIKEFDDNRQEVLLSIKEKFYDISTLNQLLNLRKNIEFKILESSKLIDSIGIQKFIQENNEEFAGEVEIKSEISKLIEHENQKNDDEKTIKIMQDGNEVIAALSDLVKYREAFIQYRQDGNELCPLCGSGEKFSNFDNKDVISIEAEKYIEQLNDRIIKIKERHKQVVVVCNQLIKQIKELIAAVYAGKIKELEKKHAEANRINLKYVAFFQDSNKLKVEISENIKENFSTERLMCVDAIEKSIRFDEKKELLSKLLMYYGFSDFSESNILEIRSSLVLKQVNSLKYVGFNLEYFQAKLNYLKRLIDNKKYLNKANDIKHYTNRKEKVGKKLEFVKNEKNELHTILTEINRKKKEFEIKELEYVGPYIYKVFIKIIKHSNINGITVKRDNSQNGGMVLVDDNGLNLMNTLSQGQLGVLMLAYFFANIIRYNNRSIFKTYFIDDITASLDDLNILAFLDMMKYIICDNPNIMNQIFFSTCNSDVEKLFIHKLKSMDIDFINLKFESYAKAI